MWVFHALISKWFKQGLPIAQLSANHTIFSEETGEIALSILAQSQPVNTRTDLKVTRAYWHLTLARYSALRCGEDLPRMKKHRVVGMNTLLSHSFL